MLKKILSALGLLLVAVLPFSCAQNDPDAPDPTGYSTATQLTRTTAIPDVLPADGISEAALRLEHFDRFGNPYPGRTVAFFIIGSLPTEFELPNVTLQFCSRLSTLGSVPVSTDITDANGVAWGVFRAGTGLVFGEDEDQGTDPNAPPFDPCDCSDGRTRFHSPNVFWTVVLGKLTDPRENEGENNIQDEVQIQHYGGSSFACGT
jgi:hypothetical protein